MESATERTLRLMLPVPVRVRHFEVPSSYLRRLLAANFLPPNVAGYLVRVLRECRPEFGEARAVSEIAESKGRLPEGFFGRALSFGPSHPNGSTCDRCRPGLGRRFLCRLCARGETVELYPLLLPNVCARHRLWVGPNVLPAEHFPVDDAAIRADKIYERLVRAGRFDAPMLNTLLGAFRRAGLASDWFSNAGFPKDGNTYLTMMQVAKRISSPTFVSQFFDPARKLRESHALLVDALEQVIGSPNPILAEAVWIQLRPVFLRIRRAMQGNLEMEWTGHDFGITPAIYDAWSRTKFSDEPMARYLDLVYLPRTPKAGRRADLSVDARASTSGTMPKRSSAQEARDSARGHPTRDSYESGIFPRRSGREATWMICRRGHPFVRSKYGVTGCPYCTHNLTLPGWTDIETVASWLLVEWDWEANGAAHPYRLSPTSGSKRQWVCRLGHPYSARVFNRFAGTGCPFCAGQRFLAGFNDIETVEPAIAAEWCRRLNGATLPRDVFAGSTAPYFWECDLGHVWEATVTMRRKGSGCPQCRPRCASRPTRTRYLELFANRPELTRDWHQWGNGQVQLDDVIAKSVTKYVWKCSVGHVWRATLRAHLQDSACSMCASQPESPAVGLPSDLMDLGSVAPELASEWFQPENDVLRPSDVRATTSVKYSWKCRAGHVWRAAVRSRVRGSGCPYCKNQKLLVGFNDLATVAPDIAKQWHQAFNGSIGPSDVLAGSAARYFWRCALGHVWNTSVDSRRRGTGCPVCSNLRVLAGYNDLATVDPDLARQWFQPRNGDVSPAGVLAGTNKKYFWICDDNHVWEATVRSRRRGRGCAVCARLRRTGEPSAIS
jgi:hypothetical protein